MKTKHRINKKIAIAGSTGLVGRTMLRVLEERGYVFDEVKLLASSKSAGIKQNYLGTDLTVAAIDKAAFAGIDFALFSAGGEISREYAGAAARSGCIVIDNSSAWRMDSDVPLVVPEVNPEAAAGHHGIIANPNCSTIQLVVALKPIHDEFRLKRLIISTYQSISGAGQQGISQLMSEIEHPGLNRTDPIAFNTGFHPFAGGDGFTVEEIKMKSEIRKIFGIDDLRIAVTCVRLPILGGHGESVNFETREPFEALAVRNLIDSSPHIVLMDDPEANLYPTPQISGGTDHVFAGRIRKDDSAKNAGYIWIVADNLRKGAATNAVQILELLIEKDYTLYDSI